MKRAAYASMEAERTEPNMHVLQQVVLVHNVNSDWLLTGQGKPWTLRESSIKPDENLVKQDLQNLRALIRSVENQIDRVELKL